MKARNIGYWLSTGLLAAAFMAGGLFDLGGSPQVVETLRHLGYPAYFAAILGTWKVLGALAITAPGLPRLKEWAYAGIVFDLTSAVISHAVVHDGPDKLFPGALLLVFTGVSWALRPHSRKLVAARAEPAAPASQRDVSFGGVPVA
jgi:uncharacterized membrane protein YphA (DoxX/SURF4 family)